MDRALGFLTEFGRLDNPNLGAEGSQVQVLPPRPTRQEGYETRTGRLPFAAARVCQKPYFAGFGRSLLQRRGALWLEGRGGIKSLRASPRRYRPGLMRRKFCGV